jgi:hypothetical protein
MIISKNNKGEVTGYMETYLGEKENVTVSVIGNISTIATRDKTTGKVESKTFFGKPLLPASPSKGTK